MFYLQCVHTFIIFGGNNKIMQSREFDNLMDGKAASFAQLSDESNVGLMGKLLRAQSKDATTEQIQIARTEIEKVEVEIPKNTRSAIDSVINSERSKGTSERAIRRIVQRRFKIQVV